MNESRNMQAQSCMSCVAIYRGMHEQVRTCRCHVLRLHYLPWESRERDSCSHRSVFSALITLLLQKLHELYFYRSYTNSTSTEATRTLLLQKLHELYFYRSYTNSTSTEATRTLLLQKLHELYFYRSYTNSTNLGAVVGLPW